MHVGTNQVFIIMPNRFLKASDGDAPNTKRRSCFGYGIEESEPFLAYRDEAVV